MKSKQVGMGTRYETQCPALLIITGKGSILSHFIAKLLPTSAAWAESRRLVLGLEVENRDCWETSGKRPRPLDLNQLSMIIIDLHTLPHDKFRGQ